MSAKKIIIACTVSFAIMVSIVIYVLFFAIAPPELFGSGDLEKERADFTTQLLRRGPAPQEFQRSRPPRDAEAVTYRSGGLSLQAWVSLNRDRNRRPAVVFVHGGFAFGRADWDQTLPFRRAGFVVMTPMLRGENGNPGNFEGFYGEVDDVIAAGEYLANLRGVDSSRVFLAGHSTGGTLSMLAAMVPSPFRAAASIGGSPDQAFFFQSYPDLAPFALSREAEVALRSPIRFPTSIRCPLYLLLGAYDRAYALRSRQLATAATECGLKCELHYVRGDHFSSVPPAIAMAIELFSNS